MVQPGQYVRMEKWLDTEVALKVTCVEGVEVVVQTFCVAGLREREIFVVSELAEVLC